MVLSHSYDIVMHCVLPGHNYKVTTCKNVLRAQTNKSQITELDKEEEEKKFDPHPRPPLNAVTRDPQLIASAPTSRQEAARNSLSAGFLI